MQAYLYETPLRTFCTNDKLNRLIYGLVVMTQSLNCVNSAVANVKDFFYLYFPKQKLKIVVTIVSLFVYFLMVLSRSSNQCSA